MSRNNKERTGKKDAGETPPVGSAMPTEDLLNFVIPTELVDLPSTGFCIDEFLQFDGV